MYITHDKYQFEIRLGDTESPIYIENKYNDTYRLRVPMRMTDDELYQYLKINSTKLIKTYEKQARSVSDITICLYTKNYGYRYKASATSSYQIHPFIYSAIPATSAVNIKKICREILLLDIKGLIGIWEERLDCIIESIYLQNYKTKPFQICTKREAIGFSVNLTEHHFSYIEFMVAKATFDYLALPQEEQEKWMQQYVIDWKQSVKVFEHERTN